MPKLVEDHIQRLPGNHPDSLLNSEFGRTHAVSGLSIHTKTQGSAEPHYLSPATDLSTSTFSRRTHPISSPSSASPTSSSLLSNVARTTAAATILTSVAKATSVGAVGSATVAGLIGTDIATFSQAVGLMAISIAADAMANVVGQNHKLTPKGVMGYATAIGGSHAIYPLVGFGIALALEYGVQGIGALAGKTVVSPEVAARVAQGVVATAVYGIGSLFLFRFLKNDMVPDFAGAEEKEVLTPEMSQTQKNRSSMFARIGARLGDLYEKGMKAIESRLLDNSQGGIESFNNMPITVRTIFRSLRHPDVVRCSMDSFVSTFAKTAFIASLPIATQVASIGLTSAAVFALVFAAGAASQGGFKLLRNAISNAIGRESGLEKNTPLAESPKTLIDKGYGAIRKHAAGINHWVGAGFKVTALATLGGFASLAGGESLASLAEAANLSGLGAGIRTVMPVALFGLYACTTVGWNNLKGVWATSRNEAREVVADIESQYLPVSPK